MPQVKDVFGQQVEISFGFFLSLLIRRKCFYGYRGGEGWRVCKCSVLDFPDLLSLEECIFDDIVNLFVETVFRLDSNLCDCDLEVRQQQPRKRVRGEDAEDREKELFEAVATEAALRSQIEDTLDVTDIH